MDTPTGSWPSLEGLTVVDGKVFYPTNEHTPTTPLYRGHKLHCIDLDTGEGLWNATGFYCMPLAISDGVLVAWNNYDGSIHAFRMGPTETTVAASPMVTTKGSSVMITGSVIDISAGTKETEQAARFPKGVPAVSDEDMTQWMEYVYMDGKMLTEVTGVTVTLDTIDPNGNFIHIDTATTDMSGQFSVAWIPEVEGKYEIIATFEGSDSYYCSYDETYITVDPAPSPAQPIEPAPTAPVPTEPAPTEPVPTEPIPTEPEPTEPEPTEPEPTEPTEAPLITTELAIIVAVIVASIIGIVSFWALKKRK